MDRQTLVWDGRRHFTGHTPDGRESAFDLPAEHGGDGTAPTPMEAVLHALAACSAVDVVAILEKMRCPAASLRVEIDCERAERHPKVFTRIAMTFIATGDVPLPKLERAVKLSAQTFCSVGAMLSRTAEITHDCVVEEGSSA